MPVPVILMLVVFAAGWFVLRRMTFGQYVYAVGGNREAAFLAGVDPYIQRIALGAVILLAVLADQINKSRGQLSG